MKRVLDFIRKGRSPKAKDPGTELNELERLFLKAMRDPKYREPFYGLLLKSRLFLGGRMSGPGQAELHYYELDAEKVLPVFSSEARLRKVLGEGLPVLPFSGLQIIRDVAPGIPWVLNPYSELGREFGVEELQELLERES